MSTKKRVILAYLSLIAWLVFIWLLAYIDHLVPKFAFQWWCLPYVVTMLIALGGSLVCLGATFAYLEDTK